MEEINLERALIRWKSIAQYAGCEDEKHIQFVCESAEFISKVMSNLKPVYANTGQTLGSIVEKSDKITEIKKSIPFDPYGNTIITNTDGRSVIFHTLPIIVKYLAKSNLYKTNYSFSNENNNPVKFYSIDVNSLFEDAQKIPDDEKFTFYNDLDQKVSKVLAEDIHKCLDNLFENIEDIVIKGLFITLEQIDNEVVAFLYCDYNFKPYELWK